MSQQEERSLLLLPNSIDGERALKKMKHLPICCVCYHAQAWRGSFIQQIISTDSEQNRSLFNGLDLPLLTFGAPEFLLVGVSCARCTLASAH